MQISLDSSLLVYLRAGELVFATPLEQKYGLQNGVTMAC